MLTRQAWDILSQSEIVYLRTNIHPTVAHLPASVELRSFDQVYEQVTDFAGVYTSIVDQIMTLLSTHDVVYAVPGDPFIAEGTVTLLMAACKSKNTAVEVIHGISFVEPTLRLLEIDGITGLQLIDALDIAAGHHPEINPDHGALIAQLFNQRVASDVKLTLMNQYPDDHAVNIVHGAGTPDQRVEKLLLYEIDRASLSHLSTLYVPPLSPEAVSSFEGFQETIAHLRAPDGCPWDREQTHLSLRSYLVEETYEVLDAIESENPDRLAEELGDLLLQVVLHSQIAVDEGEFTLSQVIQRIDAKIKRRHPHVWGGVDVHNSASQVETNWETIKAQERHDNEPERKGLLDGVPPSMPALALAYEYDRRAARVGFDWPNLDGVIAKIHEELNEVLSAKTPDEQSCELGDLLLSVAVLSRWMTVAPEDALRAACQRFHERFSIVERQAKSQGKPFSEMTADELDALWNEAKRQTRDKQK